MKEAPAGVPAVVLSLLPWVAFLVATVVGVAFADHATLDAGGLVASTPLYLGFVSLPSLAPIGVARAPRVRIGATIVMTVVAALAGLAVAMTDDAQAGLAVLFVPYVALPLALFIGIAEWAAERWSKR